MQKDKKATRILIESGMCSNFICNKCVFLPFKCKMNLSTQ